MLWAWAIGMAMGAGLGAFIGAQLMLCALGNPLGWPARAYRDLWRDIGRLLATPAARKVIDDHRRSFRC